MMRDAYNVPAHEQDVKYKMTEDSRWKEATGDNDTGETAYGAEVDMTR